MKSLKRISLATFLFLLIGITFSNGLRFKKNMMSEEVIEYDEVVRTVKKVKRIKRVPANDEDLPIVSNHSIINSLEADTANKNQNESPLSDTKYENERLTTRNMVTGYNPTNGRSSGHHSAGLNNNNNSSSAKNLTNTSSSFPGASLSGAPYMGWGGSYNDSNESKKVSFSISSISIKKGELILKGNNLMSVKSIDINGNSVSAKLIKVSGSASELVALGLSGIQLAMGKVYNLVISDAYASNTFPIEIELADGSVSPRKLEALGSAQDGFVLKWDAVGHTWVAAPDEVGAGPDGGITSITKGVGILGEGAIIETTGNIAVDAGTNANQIPMFDEDKKLVLNNNNILELDQTSTINFKENDEEFVFGMFDEVFKLRNRPNDTTIFEVVGNDFQINGRSVCLSDGTNCYSSGGEHVSTIVANPPIQLSGTNNVSLSLGIDTFFFGLNGGNQLTLLDKSITAPKLDQMGAAPGQVLKWDALSNGWKASDDLNTGLVSESDPHVHTFARIDKPLPPSCAPHQTLFYFVEMESFTCEDIELSESQTNQIVAAAVADNISDGVTDIAPSQNAVFDALETKQDTIDETSIITMKQLKLMTDEEYWVGFKAPGVATGNILFTLPTSDGDAGQVLKTDGSGNLGWVDPTSGSVTTIIANPPLSSSGTNSVTLSLQNGGITNDHINASAGISWSKIDKAGSPTISAGIALSGGGDLSTNRTLNVNVDNTTIAVNVDDQLTVKNGGISNQHISGSAGISWGKINKSGANASDIGAASNLISILAGTGLTGGGTLSTDLSLNVDVGTTANKIVQLDGNGRLPAVDGSQLTNLGTNLGKWSDAAGGIHYSSGNVGIGTTNPLTTLESRGTDAGIIVHNPGNSRGGIWALSDKRLSFAATGAIDDLVFGYGPVDAVTSENFVERMRINNVTGNVGIGTTTPSYPLEVQLSSSGQAFGVYRSANSNEYGVGNIFSLNDSIGTKVKYAQMIGGISDNTSGAYKGFLSFYVADGSGTWGSFSEQEKMRILWNGNVGIGTTSPNAPLDVHSTEIDGKSAVFNSTGTHNPSTSGMAGILINNTDTTIDSLSGISFSGHDSGGVLRHNGGIAAGKEILWETGTGAYPGYLSFWTRPSGGEELERLRITSTGNVGIGIEHPTAKLEVAGDVKATAYYHTSDKRLKTDIVPIDGALHKVMQLEGVYFRWKENDQKACGFIAQEVEKVLPELVMTSPSTGLKAVQYGNITAILVEAMKEQNQQISDQQKKIQTLEDRLQRLEKVVLTLSEGK